MYLSIQALSKHPRKLKFLASGRGCLYLSISLPFLPRLSLQKSTPSLILFILEQFPVLWLKTPSPFSLPSHPPPYTMALYIQTGIGRENVGVMSKSVYLGRETGNTVNKNIYHQMQLSVAYIMSREIFSAFFKYSLKCFQELEQTCILCKSKLSI